MTAVTPAFLVITRELRETTCATASWSVAALVQMAELTGHCVEVDGDALANIRKAVAS